MNKTLKKILLSSLIYNFLLLNPSFANDLDQENDEKIEEKSDTKKKNNIGARNISAFTRKNYTSGTSLGGYFDSEYFFPDNKNPFFDQHRLILQVSSFYNERLFFNTEIEFEHGGLLGGKINDGQLKIEQAYLDYKIEDWLISRAGVVLIPLGRVNILHDSDFRDTTARPLFNGTIMPTTWMETGAGFYGTFYPNDDWEINYETYVTQGLSDNIIDGGGLKDARPSLSSDNNGNKAVSTRVGFSPFIGFDFGLGGYYSKIDKDNKKNFGLFVGDFNYTNGPFEILGEIGYSAFDPVNIKDSAGKETSNTINSMWGYYLEAHYKFFPEFLKGSFLGLELERPMFTLFSRIDQVDTDMARLNANDRTQLTLGFNYRPIQTAVFKFEYQWNIENQAILTGDFSKEIANNQIIMSVAAGF